MSHSRHEDTRDEVDGFVHRHQLEYSLRQLRLVGMVLLLFEVASLLLRILFGAFDTPLGRLATLEELSGSLILLPLGFSLYLLGGGHKRRRSEALWTLGVHRAMLPVAVVCLVLLPLATILDATSLGMRRQEANKIQEEQLAGQLQNLDKARQARSAAEVGRLAKSAGLEVPSVTGEPAEIAIWRYELALEQRRRETLADHSMQQVSLYQAEILSPQRTFTTVVLQLISGVGLLLLSRQSRRLIRRVGLTPELFFRTDGAGPVRHRRRSNDRD